MIYFLALIPATGLTIAGFFVLYLAARSEGGLRTFGRYLGFWAFTLAGLVILGAIFAAGRHRGPHPMWGMHGRMSCPWGREHFDHHMMMPGQGPHAGPPPPEGEAGKPEAPPNPAPSAH